jgi:hypothetical protein
VSEAGGRDEGRADEGRASEPTPPPRASAPAPGKADRLRDLAALVLVVVGAALYLYAHLGMRRLAARSGYAPRGVWLMPQFDHYSRASRVGVWAVAAGVAVGVWSFLALRARARASRT